MSNMAASPVLDSYALLAFLRDEPGGEAVGAILERAGQRDQPVAMTEANYAEVQYIIRRKDGDAAWSTISKELKAVPIEFHPITRRLADLASEFKARHPLSLAAAVSLGLGFGARSHQRIRRKDFIVEFR